MLWDIQLLYEISMCAILPLRVPPRTHSSMLCTSVVQKSTVVGTTGYVHCMRGVELIQIASVRVNESVNYSIDLEYTSRKVGSQGTGGRHELPVNLAWRCEGLKLHQR